MLTVVPATLKAEALKRRLAEAGVDSRAHWLVAEGAEVVRRDISAEAWEGPPEDAIDVETTRERHGKRVLDRFHERGMTGHKSIFVHGTHLEPAEMKLLAETDSMLVSNPESNMNNGLAVSPVLDFVQHGVLVGAGTASETTAAMAGEGGGIPKPRNPRVPMAKMA